MQIVCKQLKEIDNCLTKNTLVIGAGGVSPSVILFLQKSGVKKFQSPIGLMKNVYF